MHRTLLGHKTLPMTLVDARIADRKVADEYVAVIAQVEALYNTTDPVLPRRSRTSADASTADRDATTSPRQPILHRPIKPDRQFESVCETCVHFATRPEFPPSSCANATTPASMTTAHSPLSTPASSTGSTATTTRDMPVNTLTSQDRRHQRRSRRVAVQVTERDMRCAFCGIYRRFAAAHGEQMSELSYSIRPQPLRVAASCERGTRTLGAGDPVRSGPPRADTRLVAAMPRCRRDRGPATSSPSEVSSGRAT